MEEYLCITVVSHPGESSGNFSTRLSTFWTALLRGQPEAFEKVYAESTDFEPRSNRLARQYLVEPEIVALLEAEIPRAGLDLDPIDPDDTYSKYEAVSSEWMQIEH